MKKDSPDYSDGLYSTHNTSSIQAKVAYIDEMAIPEPLPRIKLDDGSVVGFDSIDSGSTSAKPVSSAMAISTDLLAWYASQGFIGYQAAAVIAQHWLVNKACAQRGKDAVRNGYDISINDGTDVDEKVIAYIKKADKRFKVAENLRQAHRFNNVFGIRHVLFLVESDDPEYYEKPFNPDGIMPGAYKGISQIDPYWVTPLLNNAAVSDPTNPSFYEPTHWQVGSKKIHRSHFVILRGDEVSDILKPSYRYGGIPLTQRIYERVYAAERTANEGPQLAMTKRLNIRKLNLEKALANPTALAESNEFLSNQRDNYGVLYAGKDEEVAQLETSLTDLDVTIMTQYQLVASIANTPATKLLGTSPKGFNATGEHEIETYHEELETVQESEMTPIVHRHHICLMRSEVNRKFNVDFDISVEWNPLAVVTDKESAEVKFIESQTAANLINAGVIGNDEERKRLISDPDSGYNGLKTNDDDEFELDLGLMDDDSDSPAARGSDNSDNPTMDTVKKENGLWFVYSSSGERISRGYPAESQANKRLGQIEALKRNG